MLSHLEPLDESDGVRQGLVPGLHQPLPIPHRLDLLGLQRSHGTEERRVVGVAAEGLVVRLEGEGRLADSDRLVLGVPVGGVVAGEGEDVVRDGEPDDKLDVLEGWLGTQQINKSTPAVPSVDSEKLDFISYPWLSGNQVRETAGRTSCQTN